jgi:hypothetical protein
MLKTILPTIRSAKDLPLYLRNASRLRTLQNIHEGKRCVIIGNGPSLNQMDLTPLRNEITVGLNRIYLLFPKLGFSTTYLCAVNRYVIEQFAGEIHNIASMKILNWYHRRCVPRNHDLLFVRPGMTERFSRNPITEPIWSGTTVTFVAMQLAYYMGCSKVILIGVDHSFATTGPAHQVVTAEGPDRNHFDPDYFGKGTRWQLPDLETSERAYRLAKHYFEIDGREIVDATLDGHLQVYPKRKFIDIFSS